MDKDQELMLQAFRIVSGESMLLPSIDMLRALLRERTDLVAALQLAKEGLEDAVHLQDTEIMSNFMFLAIYYDTIASLHKTRWLNREDDEWEKKVLK